MIHAIRQDVVVLPGGRIEIVSSELTPGAHAEVIVLEDAPKARQQASPSRSSIEGSPAAARKEAKDVSRKPKETPADQPQGLMERRAFMKLPLQERRRILAEQADRLADHYRQNVEVRDLGGGDFLDC